MTSISARFGFLLSISMLLAGPLKLAAQTPAKSKSVSSQTKITTSSPEDVAGLIKYEPNEAAKRVGLDSKSENYGKFNRLLAEHDKNVDLIVHDNQQLFDQLYLLKVEYEGQATALQDFSPLVTLIKLMEEHLLPIAGSVKKENEYLSTLMGYILDEKQFKKWKRYLSKVAKSKGPKYPRPMAGPLLVE